MATKEWMVAVVSTSYDLIEERKNVIKILKENRFKVSAFETPDYPAEPQANSHDACLIALDRADIIVLIINKRYGGLYLGDKKYSITEAELNRAISQNKMLISCIENDAWNEKETYNKGFKDFYKKHSKSSSLCKLEELEKEFANQYKCKYVEKVETIQFINRVRSLKTNNFLNFYSTVNELTEIVINKLKGFSRYLCELVVKKQYDFVNVSQDSIDIEFSIQNILENKKYYVNPKYEVVLGSTNSNRNNMPNFILKLVDEGYKTLIMGSAGSGKSVLISKLFLKNAKDFFKNSQSNKYKMPFYISLRNKGENYHFKFQLFIQECINEYFNKDNFPLLDISDIVPIIYIDGFDELCENITKEKLKYISKSSIITMASVIAARKSFAQKFLIDTEFDITFNFIIKIKPWDKDIAKKFISNFCKKNNDLNEQNVITSVIDENENEDIYTSPLFLTILLWLIRESEIDVPFSNAERTMLLKKCLECFIKRELNKESYNNKDTKDILKDWANVAWIIFYYRSQGKNVTLDEIQNLIKENIYKVFSYSDLYKPELVFEINPITKIIKGTYHEQFLEFLVSHAILEGCLNAKYPYPLFLYQIIRPEINAMIDMEYNSYNENEKKRIYESFWNEYLEGLMEDDVDELKQIQSLYHLSKLKSDRRDKYLKIALNCEKNIIVMPSLYFIMVKNGDLAAEEQFMTNLKSDNELSNNNRGFHLAYYGDRVYQSMPYLDDNEKNEWKKTFEAILKHFGRKEQQYYYIRRIDLHMIYELMMSRNSVGPVTAEALEYIKSVLLKDHSTSEFNNKVKKEYNELVDLYNKYTGENISTINIP